MEQTIAFVLGVLSVLVLAGVYNVFRTNKKIKELKQTCENLEDTIDSIEREYHRDLEVIDRRIDGEIDRLNATSEKIYKYIDSRTDKMESRTEDAIAKLVADLYSDMDARFNDNTGFVDKLFHQIADLGKSKKQK